MINSILVSDSNDNTLGDFFEKCKVKSEEILQSSQKEINLNVIPANAAFDMVLPMQLPNINADRFIFVSYTHGSETELLQNGVTPFISSSDNENHLKNAFAYCFACEAGTTLGKELCEKGTIAFIGYDKEVTVQVYFNAEESFIECATSGLTALVNGMSIKDVYSSMKEKYNDCIDEFYTKDFLTASLFMDNRDALVLHGNGELTIDDL